MVIGDLISARPSSRLAFNFHAAFLAGLGMIAAIFALTIPASTTLESRASLLTPEPADTTGLPERIVAPIPPLSEGAAALDPAPLVHLPTRIWVAAEQLLIITDKELALVRARLERERQEALRRQTLSHQQAPLQAAAIATNPAASPVKLSGPIAPQERWIDINLTAQVVTAMVGSQPVHVALTTTGAKGWETPTGEFRIIYRVYNETMTSASLGIPAEVENYRLENVLFTQYFTTQGHALHLNYWRPDYYFGNIPSSHGCAGLRYADAAYFWEFASIGTRVVIHY